MAQVANPTTVQRLTVQEAAAQIVEIINSRATNPQQEEIEAIIAKVSRSISITDVVRDIASLVTNHEDIERRLLRAGSEPAIEPSDARRELHRLDDRKDALEKLVFKLEPKDLNEVMTLLAIASSTLEHVGDHLDGDANSSTGSGDVKAVAEAIDEVVHWADSRGAGTPVSWIYTVLGDQPLPAPAAAPASAK